MGSGTEAAPTQLLRKRYTLLGTGWPRSPAVAVEGTARRHLGRLQTRQWNDDAQGLLGNGNLLTEQCLTSPQRDRCAATVAHDASMGGVPGSPIIPPT